jgi:uncharacterized protein
MRVLILEPVGSACNLRCAYCYQEPVREKKKIIELELLRKIFSEINSLNGKTRIIWHGGEPLLAGLNFLEKAIEAQKEYTNGCKIVNSIQTNATLITEKWAKFLAKNEFRVSVSLDGSRKIHDAARSKSFRRTVQGIKQLRRFSKKNGMLITISKYNVDFPELIWKTIIEPKELAESFDVSVVSPTEKADLTPPIDKSFEFLKKIFDLWMTKDNPGISIRSFMSILRALKGGNPHLCSLEYGKCGGFLAIDNLGDAYFCNRFMKREIAYLGNISQQSLKTLFEIKKKKYGQMVILRSECQKCEWLSACGGGCPYYKWAATGSFSGSNPECLLKKRFLTYIKEKYLS